MKNQVVPSLEVFDYGVTAKKFVGYRIINNKWIWTKTIKKASQNFSKILNSTCVQLYCSRGIYFLKIRVCILKRQLNFFATINRLLWKKSAIFISLSSSSMYEIEFFTLVKKLLELEFSKNLTKKKPMTQKDVPSLKSSSTMVPKFFWLTIGV